jgi:hypothetical protein
VSLRTTSQLRWDVVKNADFRLQTAKLFCTIEQ